MSKVRTTVSLQPEVYEEARANYQSLGFARLSDLISTAVHGYLQQRRKADMDGLMAVAAKDKNYRKVVLSIAREMEPMDSDGLDSDY